MSFLSNYRREYKAINEEIRNPERDIDAIYKRALELDNARALYFKNKEYDSRAHRKRVELLSIIAYCEDL
jgi:hypothetical protein